MICDRLRELREIKNLSLFGETQEKTPGIFTNCKSASVKLPSEIVRYYCRSLKKWPKVGVALRMLSVETTCATLTSVILPALDSEACRLLRFRVSIFAVRFDEESVS